MAIIEVNHVTKEFRLGQLHGLKQTMLDTVARLRNRAVAERAPFKALDDVDFKVEQGEVLGIIGHNGAGKSTLLKLLARISVPTHGSVNVRGSVAPLIEVGAGLVPDLTGRENIHLNAVILGMRRAEVAKRFDDIVAFAELEQFIDTPIKRYSSGMQVRLGFSIATTIEADVLIVDEVLAVGDLAFQRKCFDRMEDMIKRQGKTVLLVSHNIRQVERLCSRVILLEHGRILENGSPHDVCNALINHTNALIQENRRGVGVREIQNSGDLSELEVQFVNHKGEMNGTFEFLNAATIRFKFRANSLLSRVSAYVGIHTADFVYLTNHNTAYQPRDFDPGMHTIELTIKELALVPGVYSILFWIGTPEGKVSYHAENLATFRVMSTEFWISRQQSQALFHMPAEWRFDPTGIAQPTVAVGNTRA